MKIRLKRCKSYEDKLQFQTENDGNICYAFLFIYEEWAGERDEAFKNLVGVLPPAR